jgi:insulysin
VPHAEQLNSAVEMFLYVGDDYDQQQRVRLQLFTQLASEPCFDQLRTKEQLGYIVQSSARGSIGSHGFRVIVQSERDADHVEARIEAWFETFRQLIVDMPETEFAQQRQSLIHRKLEDYKNMNQECVPSDSGEEGPMACRTHAYWMHIHSGYYDFLRSARPGIHVR